MDNEDREDNEELMGIDKARIGKEFREDYPGFAYGSAVGTPIIIKGDGPGYPPKESDNVRLILELLGVAYTEDNYAVMSMFVRAYQIYIERQAKYHDAWKRYGALNNLIRSASKLQRVQEVYWYPDEVPLDDMDLDLDDAFDALNYLAFFITQAERGEWKRG